MGMHNYRELKIWKRSMDFVEQMYRLTASFPTEEKYGISSQIKKAAVSIPSNIAEGAGRSTDKQFKYFLEIAMGSCNEIETQLELAARFGYLNGENYKRFIDEISQIYRMVYSFYNSLIEQ